MNRLRELLKLTPKAFPFFRDWSVGMAVGLLFILLFSRLRLALGGSADVIVASLIATAMGVLVYVSLLRKHNRILTAIAFIAISCWAFLQPVVLSLAMKSVGQFTLLQLHNPITQFGILFVIILSSIFPFILASAVISAQRGLKKNLFLGGLATSLFVMPILMGGILAPVVVQLIAVTLLASVGIQLLLKPSTNGSLEELESSSFSLIERVEDLWLTGCLGVAFAVASFIGHQLMLNDQLSEFALFGGIFAGWAVARSLPFKLKAAHKWLSLACWSALLAIVFQTLTWLALSETIWISNTILLFASRALLVACLTFPLGLLVPVHRQKQTDSSINLFLMLNCFSTGFVLALLSETSAGRALTSLILVSLIAIVSRYVLTRDFPQTRFQWLRTGIAFGIILFGSMMISRIDLARSEKILFTGNTYAAFRGGADWSLLPWLDDGRLVEQHSNLAGRWSLWKQRGQQTAVRENGLITEIKSENIAACPLNAAEVMPSLFPLVAHEAAENVLVLGMHGTTLQTCESFPLRSVTVLEESQFFHEMKTWVAAKLLDCSAIQFLNTDLQLGMNSQHEQAYDVIIAPNAMTATTESIAQRTIEFYRAVNSHLGANGIFCQRLAYYDLGPEAVRQFAATLKQVFPQVLVVESVPGEVLLVGSQQKETLVTKEFVRRLQLPQTRQTLSAIGWDWSIPASRGTLDNDAVQEWVAGSGDTVSIRRVDPLFSLPTEIARWDTKSQQTGQALAKHGMALGGYLGEGEESLEIQQRLEDLQLAHSILNNNPDNIWGYRAALKKQLTERPRSKIMQVKHEGLKRKLHPDDQRRKDYLQTLGELAKAEAPTLKMVDHLIQFMQPFDPLLGPFVSNETFHQLKRVESGTESAQYHNLLYSIYFSTAADKSVRNLAEATNLLCQHPEIVSTEADRWDQLNGLVEMFRHRWQLRFHDRSHQSEYEIIDTERSLAAVKLAVKEMEELAPTAGLSEEDWTARNEIIQETLVRPLRLHRSQQLRRRQVK